MKIARLYVLSVIMGYMLFVICAMLLMFINAGAKSSWRGVYVFAMGGFLYIPIFAISNLTQFILLKKPNEKLIVFFSSILVIIVISLIGIKMNMMDDFLWKILMTAQLIVSLIAFYYYKTKVSVENK